MHESESRKGRRCNLGAQASLPAMSALARKEDLMRLTIGEARRSMLGPRASLPASERFSASSQYRER
jgi:hypothetical protein